MNIKKQIPLNLIFTYPVHWSKYKVLRDFIQNFYDSVSHKEFYERFKYELTDRNELIFTALNTNFNYEWLIHIGASTKREEKEKYAGYFGEGFKIASLCALRDFNWNVTMSSNNWSLDVIRLDLEIDEKSLFSLGYDISIMQVSNKDTILKISNFDKNDYDIFLSALYTFYYKENPLLGEQLWENEICAVYHRSSFEKPKDLPTSYDSKGDGIVFGSYQALGSFEFPFVFCLHDYKQDDRDRSTYSKVDVINILVGVIRCIGAQLSLTLLNAFEKYWYTYPKEKYGYKSYYTVIKNLIIKLHSNSHLTNKFVELNPNLLVADKIPNNNLKAKNKRRQAMTWLKLQDSKYTLVQDTFEYLGYPSIEDKCEEDHGFTLVRVPNALETNYINLLEDYVQELFTDFFEISRLPSCKVITNNDASWDGMAESTKLIKARKNSYGFKIRKEIHSISLKIKLFESNNFHDALSTYLHELCHIFGGDSSMNFSRALTEVIRKVIDSNDVLSEYRLKWLKIK